MNRLARFFKLRPGEGKTALLLTGLMFLVSAGMFIGTPGIESLFLTRFGFQSLPYMYIALGLVTAAVTILISTLLRRMAHQLLYRILPLGLALALGLGRVLIIADFSWLYPILFLCIYIFWTIQNLFAWGTAGMVYDTRQAKRLFPLLGAGGILGSAVGGLVTKPLVSVLGAANLMLVWGGTLVVGAVLIELLIREAGGSPKSKAAALGARGERDRITRRRGAADKGPLTSVREGFTFVTGSRFMRWFAAAAILYGTMYFVLLFPFSREATLQYAGADGLAGFLGLFQGSAMAAGFLLSLLAANRLFARIGFVPSIWVLAFIYLAGFSLAALFPLFGALIVFRFFQMSWQLGIATSAYQAVFNIVRPKQREQTRMLVTGIARPLGISLAGAVLVALRLLFSLDAVYLVGAAVALGAVLVVLFAGRAYRQALFEALRAGRPDIFVQEEQPFGGFARDENATAVALKSLSAADPHVRRTAAEILGHLQLPKAADGLVAALQDPDGGVRAAVLTALGNMGASSALSEISAHLQDPVPEVRLQALRALHRLSRYATGLGTRLHPLLDDPQPAVRAAAAAVLVELSDAPQGRRTLQVLLGSADDSDRISALRACAEWRTRSCYESVRLRSSDPSPVVRDEALRALADIDAEASADLLIRALGDESRFVAGTAASLIHRAGRAALPPLVAALEEPALEEGALEALHFFSPEALQEQSRSLRAFARRKIQEIRRYRELLEQPAALPAEPGSHLYGALRQRLLQAGVAALWAAGLLSDPLNAAVAIRDLRSDNGNQKANALEMLDGLKEKEILRAALPLFEQGLESGQADPSGRTDAVGFLLSLTEERDPWLRACAAYTMRDFDDPRIRSALRRLAWDEDFLVRETVEKMLNGGTKMKRLPALSTLERIFFLEKVPLFAEFSPAELKQVAAICQEQSFADGEALGGEGEVGEEMFIIIEGEVRVLKDERTGEELARRGAGEYVGEMTIISREPRMATMVASGEVRVLSIAQPEFEQILRSCPDASMAVMRVLCDRLRESRLQQPVVTARKAG
ncbi:MAG: HEAT repeat domain-containing protein [Spirochaetales bacterium]|nr:HEAT repeat domain-containing protein [Spirochaetales bacterium]